jgi:hypothetical protein
VFLLYRLYRLIIIDYPLVSGCRSFYSTHQKISLVLRAVNITKPRDAQTIAPRATHLARRAATVVCNLDFLTSGNEISRHIQQ